MYYFILSQLSCWPLQALFDFVRMVEPSVSRQVSSSVEHSLPYIQVWESGYREVFQWATGARQISQPGLAHSLACLVPWSSVGVMVMVVASATSSWPPQQQCSAAAASGFIPHNIIMRRSLARRCTVEQSLSQQGVWVPFGHPNP